MNLVLRCTYLIDLTRAARFFLELYWTVLVPSWRVLLLGLTTSGDFLSQIPVPAELDVFTASLDLGVANRTSDGNTSNLLGETKATED